MKSVKAFSGLGDRGRARIEFTVGTRVGACLLAGLVGLAAASVRADHILEVNSDSLTTYQPSGVTTEQDVRPLYEQRGVLLDGTARAGSGFAWAFAGNPFGEGWNSQRRMGDMDLALGAYGPTEIDVALPAPGQGRWVIGRTYSQVQEVSAAHHTSNGYQGKNWFQSGQPQLVRFEGATDDKDMLYIVHGADRFLEFVRTGSTSDYYKGKNGTAGVIKHVSGSPDTYEYYDQHGTITHFFGSNTGSSRANYQLWKIVDQAGNTAYVGDASTASTAVTSGYNTDGSISTAYDAASSGGRRYSYTYTTLDSVSRLTEVKVETKTGGTWSSPSGLAEVARVTYAYYQTGDNTHGPNGHLKMVAIRRSLSDSGTSLSSGVYEERKQYYRYYTGTWADSDGRRGGVGMLKMVVDFEGCRNFDWGEAGAESPEVLDNGFTSASDTSLKSYSAAYFEYPSGSDWKASKAFYSGECGCSGGVAGTYEFTYETNGSFSPVSGYDTEWHRRTVVKQPDLVYATVYFDEACQPLSRVVTDAAPSGAYTDMWATEIVRDSAGCITEIRSPAANDTYTHSSGALTAKAGAGLITVIERDSGDTTGFATLRKHKTGTGGTATLDSKTVYTTRAFNFSGTSVYVTRPMVSERWAYHTAASSDSSANRDTTTTSYSWWSGTSTSIQYIAVKQATTTHPAVSTVNNGSNSATTTARYVRKDGTTAFTESALSYFDYAQYADGRLSKRIDDCQTNHGSDFASGDDPSTDFGISESGSGSRRITTMTYDAQGRPDVTTAPDGTLTKMYSSRLEDGQLVSIAIPRYTTGGSTTYFGPASYGVANHAGRGVFSGVIAIASSGTTTALSGWIDEADDDPITALDVGTLARMSTTQYDEPGLKQETGRAYFEIPASGAGSDGTNYDQTSFGYDDMGRARRVLDATGTIRRTTYDELGRVASRSIGTNDNGLAGGSASGTSNMVTTEALEYDSGADGGNGHLTKRTLYVQDSTTDQRETSFLHDVRGRAIVTINPQAPHVLSKFDNLGRQVATGLYSSSSGLDAADDPTSLATHRMALSRTYHDERGQVYKAQRYKIDDADGFEVDNLETLTWYDPDGRVIKVEGESYSKTRYDRLGRVTHQFTLANSDDSQYGHASASTAAWDSDDKTTSVAGDIVVEEHQTTYESTDSDNVVMSASISRFHGDYGTGETTGALDTNADANAFKLSAADLEGRAQISATWYDELDRPTDAVAYGTYGGSDFDRKPSGSWLSVPARSDTALRTSTSYNDDGTVLDATDPRGQVSRTLYDDLGRRVASIANYVNGTPTSVTGDDDVYTRYEFADGLNTAMWVDLDGDGVKDADDQVTTYIYGATKGTPAAMKIAAGHLLRAIKYPDSTNGGTTSANIDSDSSDVESFAYNAQGQLTYKKDQMGTVLEADFDTAGRRTHQRATTIASGIDSAVARISWAYDSLGRVSTATQHDNAVVGSGSVVDEVKHRYDDWSNLEYFEQDRNSAVDAPGSVDDYEVRHYSTKSTAGRNTVYRSRTKLADTTNVYYECIGDAFSAGDDAHLARVNRVKVETTVVATYKYLGAGHVVGTEYDEPDVYSRRYGASAGDYEDFDRFDRVEDWDWTRDLATDRNFYDVGVAYDRNSNITSVDDRVHGGFDAAYTNDGLDRLSRAEEGTLSGGSISSRSRDQQWTLEQTGNWELDKVDLNGDGDFVDSGELNDDRTHNVVNELTARDTDDNGSNNHTLSYNARGDMTSDGDDYTYKYDAFGRLKAVYAISGASLVAEYKYNGLGFRIGWHYDADADGTVENTSDDPWYLFVYDERWRIVNTYRLADWSYSVSNPTATNSKERFVYHAAGLGGWGGSSYIDSVILRDRDMNTSWTAASDGTLEKRHYYCQNWRADVSAIVDSSGKMVEWIKYSAYGVPFSLPSGDTDSDLDWDATDSAAMTGSYDVRKDADLDGDVDAADTTHANSIKPSTGYQTLGRGVQSSTGVENRKSYAGYEYDPTFKGAGRVIMHVRHRVYDAELGRWGRRDPAGYVDGLSMFHHVRSGPLIKFDPLGLVCQRAGEGCGGQYKPPELPWWVTGCSTQTSSWRECMYCCHYYSDGQYTQDRAACEQVCGRRFPDDPPEAPPPPTWAQCTLCSLAEPDLTTCARAYGPCDCLYGANVRCMCQCMGNGSWENFVRACLQCMKRVPGISWETAHRKCWNAGVGCFGISQVPFYKLFVECIPLCEAMQRANCPGECNPPVLPPDGQGGVEYQFGA